MKRKSILFTMILGVFFYQKMIAQITQIELMSGIPKTDFTYFSVKMLDNKGHFSISNLAFFQKYHKDENSVFDEVGVQSTLFWNFTKHLSIGPSLYFNSVSGFTERISLLSKIRGKTLNISIISSLVHAEDTKTINGEVLVQLQFQQRINAQWGFVLNGLLLSNWDRFSRHTRSFQQLRTGLVYRQTQFGIAVDLDQYGPKPISKTSFGLFLKKSFLGK